MKRSGIFHDRIIYHGQMKKKLGLAFACLCLTAPLVLAKAPVSDPGATSGLAEARAAQAETPTSELDSALFYQLLIGEMSAQEGDPAAGFALMLDAARKTHDAQLYQRATEIALQSRSGDSALQAARAWNRDLPASREANRYVLQILLALNRVAESEEALKAEIKMAPAAEKPAVFMALPLAYARVSDKKLASTLVQTALAEDLKNPATAAAAWTAVGRLRLAADDSAGAFEAAQRGLAADANAEGPVLLALELMDTKMPEAEALVRKFFKNHAPQNANKPALRMAYAQTLLSLLRYAEAMPQLQLITRESPDFPQAWLVLGSLQLQENHLSQAQTSLERYLALVKPHIPAQAADSQDDTENAAPVQAPDLTLLRDLDQAYLALSQLAQKKKDYAAADSWLGQIKNPNALAQVQSRRASILASQGKLAEGRALIQQLPETTAQDGRRKIKAEISLLREFNQYQLAHDLLAQALLESPDDIDLLYDQAMMAEKLDKLDDMERLLRQIIKLKPDYHHAYNALGYSLADRGVRLPEARDLIRKALTFAPSDPFIEDSLGWVEFRMGNQTEALRIFESAYKTRPDAEIGTHFGEVLWSMGQRDRALAIWKEAHLIDPDNEALAETLKRLNVKL